MPIVTFYVGPDKVVFHVHQNLVFDASPVFKAAFSGSFKEASERSMSLPEDDKDSVGHMIRWLYTKKFDLTISVCRETSGKRYMQLAMLNTLAEKYDIYLLKNDIVDELFALTKPPRDNTPPPPPQIPVIKHVYDNTTEGSSFRKLMVAWYAYRIDFKWYSFDSTKSSLAKVSHDFAIDLAIALSVRVKHPDHQDRENPFTLPSSTFHETPPKEANEEVKDLAGIKIEAQ